MNAVPADSTRAADALRKLAETRIDRARDPRPGEVAQGWIAVLWLIWLPTQFFALAVAGMVGLPTDDDSLWVVFLLVPAAIPMAAAAGAAGAVTLRYWSLLSGLWIAAGMVPWVVVAAEAVAVLVAAL